jgi:hypothetical protein
MNADFWAMQVRQSRAWRNEWMDNARYFRSKGMERACKVGIHIARDWNHECIVSKRQAREAREL